ncbi:MAG: response regulator transcription factor [Fusobacteriaceae bacterium]|jgi:DNA-binding response OmpR family regulator|nr:response regulator transcription factor [Fusobacteriaceae bacterium]
MKFNILIVEDEVEISEVIKKYIEHEGYNYKVVENGFQALEAFNQDTFHLVLLDVMLPGIDGFQVLKEIRTISSVPIIMITAKRQEVDRLKGFDEGADDYVVKPFSPRELIKRIKVFFKRIYNESDEVILHIDQFKLFLNSRKLFKNDEEIEITATEFQLLQAFMNNKGIVLTRERLIELAFGYEYEGFDRNIDVYIKRLRNKIEENPSQPKYLVTKFRAGYVFGGES